MNAPTAYKLASPKKPVSSTKEYDDDSDYQYKLKGIIVHNGNAQAGHYYSYINTVLGVLIPVGYSPHYPMLPAWHPK